MTRDEYLAIRREGITGQYSAVSISKLLYEYCMEKGATDTNLINQCSHILMTSGQWQPYYKVASRYFDVKFEVTLVYGKCDSLGLPREHLIMVL